MLGAQFGLVLYILAATWSEEPQPQTFGITEHMQWSTRMTYGSIDLQRTAMS